MGIIQKAEKCFKKRPPNILFVNTLAALAATIKLMRELDEQITQRGGWPVQ